MEVDLSDLKEQFTSVETKLDKILTILKGDDFGKDLGLVKDYQTMRKDVDELKDFKKSLYWVAGTASAIFGLIWKFLLDKFMS